jgi:hypothetical protein
MQIIQMQGVAYLNTLGLWNDGTTCCMYAPMTSTTTTTTTTTVVPFIDLFDGVVPNPCVGPFSITTEGLVNGVESSVCCNISTIGPIENGYSYYWDGKNCYYRKDCPTTLTCVDCTNFDWWNDTYISNHGGQGLQLTSPILWQQIVNLVTNSGQTFYVNSLDGEPLDEVCCIKSNGSYKDGICFCDKPTQELSEPRCISNLNDFLNLISTTEGYTFFTTNFSTIGPSLDLTAQQINFILANINNSGDTNSNGISDLTEARLILSNSLNLTGGFYVNFGLITGDPTLVNKGICDQYKGYWDASITNTNTGTNNITVGTSTGSVSSGVNTVSTQATTTLRQVGTETPAGTINLNTFVITQTPSTSTPSDGNCMCKPIVDQCVIDITEVKIINY